MKRRKTLAVCFALLFCTSVFGDTTDLYDGLLDLLPGQEEQNAGQYIYPILLIPMGGPRQGMGTAHTAVSADLGFMESNPAGSVDGEGAALAVAHRQWIAESSIDSAAFSISQRAVGLGIGGKFFYSPFTAYDDAGVRTASGTYLEYSGVLNASIRLVSLPALNFSVGANAKLVGRHVQRSIAENQSAYAVPFDFGLLVRTRFGDFSESTRRNMAFGATIMDFGQIAATLDAPMPTRFVAGIAYSPVNAVLVSMDFALPLSLYPDRFLPGSPTYALGIEANITRFLAIQTGASLTAENLQVSVGGSAVNDGLTISAAYSADIVGGLNPLDTMSVMMTMQLGERGE